MAAMHINRLVFPALTMTPALSLHALGVPLPSVCSLTLCMPAGQRVFVISLGRAGEDDKSFKLTDVDSTFAGFAGADFEIQVGLTNAMVNFAIVFSEAEA